MFDVKSIPMSIVQGESVTEVTVNPEELYPAMIARIREVLDGANPSEILASTERGGSARADVLIANARTLPEQAWQDALRRRDEFTSLPYSSFVKKNGRAREDILQALDTPTREAVVRMIQRGYALEIAYGWFCQALRLAFGAYELTITRDEAYRL